MRLIASLLLAGIAVVAATSDGSAQVRRHKVVRGPSRVVAASSGIESLPLTVNRRSWLDPGPVASQGTGTAYVAASTQFARTQDRIFSPDKFGNDVIIGQPYVPGRTVPVAEFSTYPNGTATVDNLIGPQNYYFNPAGPGVATDYSFQENAGRGSAPTSTIPTTIP